MTNKFRSPASSRANQPLHDPTMAKGSTTAAVIIESIPSVEAADQILETARSHAPAGKRGSSACCPNCGSALQPTG